MFRIMQCIDFSTLQLVVIFVIPATHLVSARLRTWDFSVAVPSTRTFAFSGLGWGIGIFLEVSEKRGGGPTSRTRC